MTQILVAILFFVVIPILWDMPMRRRQRHLKRQAEADQADRTADMKLWDVLKDEDPAWLAYMGIRDWRKVTRNHDQVYDRKTGRGQLGGS
jgi:hypothetical protein